MTRDALQALRSLMGEAHVNVNSEDLKCYSNDLFFWSDGKMAEAIVAPPTAESTAELVAWARAQNYKLFTRGGGMSCSAGYVPNHERSIVVDMEQLRHVRCVDVANGYVEVECGITWETLFSALDEYGVSTVFEAPVSG